MSHTLGSSYHWIPSTSMAHVLYYEQIGIGMPAAADYQSLEWLFKVGRGRNREAAHRQVGPHHHCLLRRQH